MEWLNRLDEALGEAVEANQRMNQRREQRHVNDSASLSQLVQHLRPGTVEDSRSVGTSPAVLNSERTLPQNSTSQRKASQQVISKNAEQNKNQTLDATQRLKKFSSQDKTASTTETKEGCPPTESTASLSANSPSGRALGSMSSPSKYSSPQKSKLVTETQPAPDEKAVTIPIQQPAQKSTSQGSTAEAQHLKETKYDSDGSFEDVSLVDVHKSSTLVIDDNSSSNSQAPSEEPERLPQHVTVLSEFDVARIETDWNANDSALDPKRNCYGVVHVRILRAKHLPCPVGSKVLAVVALPPWTGKVRTNKATAFFAKSSTSGVCVDWSEMESASVSMVHAYSNDDSPVPSIRIGVFFSASPLGMLEMEMCHVEITCTALLREPLQPFQGWFATKIDKRRTRHKEQSPLIQIEAMFEPEDHTAEETDTVAQMISSPVATVEVDHSNIQVDDASLLDDYTQQSSQVDDSREVALSQSARSTNNDTITKSKGTKIVNQDERSVSDFSTSLNSLRPANVVVSSSKMHLLGLKAYYMFARCHICSRSITSGFSRKAAYHCEQCGIDVCCDCRLQVDVRLPCGSKAAAKAVENSLQSKLKPENIMNMVAPIPEMEHVAVDIDGETSLTRVTSGPSSVNISDIERPSGNIGSLKARILRAVVPQTPLGPTSFPEDVLCVTQVSKGDYYVRIHSSDGVSQRTPTVQRSGRPTFSTDIRLSVDHYETEFFVELIDATTDEPVGQNILTAKTILQKQRDSFSSSTVIPFVWIFGGPVGFDKTRRISLDLRKAKKQKSHSFFARGSVGDIVGAIELDLILEENVRNLFGRKPTECTKGPPEDLDLALLQQHIGRISDLVTDVKQLIEVYSYVVSGKC